MPTLLEPTPAHPAIRQAAKIAALEQRIAALERDAMAVPVKFGAPAAGDGTEGSIAGDSSTTRLWLRVGNAWHYVGLT